MALRASPLPRLLQRLPRSPPNDHLTDSLVSVSEASVGPSRPFQKSGLEEQGGLGGSCVTNGPLVDAARWSPAVSPGFWVAVGVRFCTLRGLRGIAEELQKHVSRRCVGVCEGGLVWLGRGRTTGATWPSAVSVHKPNFSPKH